MPDTMQPLPPPVRYRDHQHTLTVPDCGQLAEVEREYATKIKGVCKQFSGTFQEGDTSSFTQAWKVGVAHACGTVAPHCGCNYATIPT